MEIRTNFSAKKRITLKRKKRKRRAKNKENKTKLNLAEFV